MAKIEDVIKQGYNLIELIKVNGLARKVLKSKRYMWERGLTWVIEKLNESQLLWTQDLS